MCNLRASLSTAELFRGHCTGHTWCRLWRQPNCRGWPLQSCHLRVQIVETDEVLEVIWNIPLGAGSVKIRKTDRYLKNSEVCELQRRDGRHGALRSQLNFTPEGHIHIRWGAAVHRRLNCRTQTS